MKLAWIGRRLALAGLALMTLAVFGCSKKDSMTPAVKELDSKTIQAGGNFQHAFMNPGSFPYHCELHPGPMRGTVTVDPGSASTNAAVSIQDFRFDPSSVTVGPGGTVTWTNDTPSTPHTVTSD